MSKDTVRRMKRQATNSEKILVNHLYDKVPISRINQELSNLNNKKKNQNEQMIWTDTSSKNICERQICP